QKNKGAEGPSSTRRRRVLVVAAATAELRDRFDRPSGRVIGGGSDIELVSRDFRIFTKAIGMEWVTPHVLRHTWASLAAINGVPLFEIAKVLGDSLAMVEKVYVHLTPNYLVAAVNH